MRARQSRSVELNCFTINVSMFHLRPAFVSTEKARALLFGQKVRQNVCIIYLFLRQKTTHATCICHGPNIRMRLGIERCPRQRALLIDASKGT